MPVSEAQEIYANRRDAQVRLLLMPGHHDEFGDLERHMGTVIGFLDDTLGMKFRSNCKRVPSEALYVLSLIHI